MRNDNKGRDKTGYWIRQEHLFGKDTYKCSVCGSLCSKPEAFCPRCRAKMRKTKYDPVWIDEMEFYD